LKNLESKVLESLKILNREAEQILIDIYNSHLNDNNDDVVTKYERHINSLVLKNENKSYLHYLLEVLIEKIHQRIRV